MATERKDSKPCELVIVPNQIYEMTLWRAAGNESRLLVSHSHFCAIVNIGGRGTARRMTFKVSYIYAFFVWVIEIFTKPDYMARN